MIKQTLFFSTPVSLSLKNAQMVVKWKESEKMVTRPIEDMGCVVLENQRVSVTLPLLNELVRNKVAVVLCDEKGMPTSMLQVLDGNNTQAESQKWQLEASEPMKKQAWKQVVEAKVRNQAALLDKYGKSGSVLKPFYMNVKSGDSDNREGAAARLYWEHLFGADFKRDRYGVSPNEMLNYGYTILRALTARALISSGLFPNIGIYHKNRYNAFPLADDIMEPYRPYVDEVVYNLFLNGHECLDMDAKVALLKVLTCDVTLEEVTRPLQIALTFTTASLVKYFAGETKRLSLPSFR